MALLTRLTRKKFHHTFLDFQKLPDFYKLTRLVAFSFWNVSLKTPIQYVQQSMHFQRLFPHGGGFLMTEDFMLHERDAAIIILAWFRDWVKRKTHNTWKLMLRPKVMEWLRGKYDEDPR
jgi:chromo domain-containing protein 1